MTAAAVVVLAGVTATVVLPHGSRSHRADSRLVDPGASEGGTAGITKPHALADHPYTFGAIMVCVSGRDPVRITNVRLGSVTGELRVTDFGVASGRHEGVGEVERTARAIKGFSGRTVLDRCADKVYSEIAVTVRRPPGTSGKAANLRLTYVSPAGKSGHLDFPLGLGLCAQGASAGGTCRS